MMDNYFPLKLQYGFLNDTEKNWEEEVTSHRLMQRNGLTAYLSFTNEYMRSLSSMHFFHSGLSPWRSR